MIDWFVTAFLKASLFWFACAVALAAAMALVPTLTMFRAAHLHLALLGFVAQMIYGVALHLFPRMFGRPMLSRRLAGWQFWCAQGGLVALVAGFALRVAGAGAAPLLVAIGGALSAGAVLMFVVNLWRTVEPRDARPGHQTRVMPLAKS